MRVPRPAPTNPAARRDWARRHITNVPAAVAATAPAYGTAQWAELDDSDPAKLAAAIIAAECWATDLEELPARLRVELEAARAAFEAAWEARWAFLFRDAVKVAHAAATPAAFRLRAHYAKTQAQRIAEARKPRPTDRYPRTGSGEHAA